MAKINSVLGTIDTADLGFTLMHEHFFIGEWSMRQAFHDWVDVDAAIEKAVQEVRIAKQHGVQTIVDVTPIPAGRDLRVMREIAERAEMQIIVATGLWQGDEMGYWGREVDRLVEFLIRDIETGIEGTNVKAGIIKAATGPSGVTPNNLKTLQVAARLHLATGVPITTHTSAQDRTGLAQQDAFEAEGVDLGRVVIGHSGDTEDLEYLEELLKRGSWIGMDRFGFGLPDEKRVATVAALCQRGWAERMVLSHDYLCYTDWGAGMEEGFRERNSRWSFHHIPDNVIPALHAAGVGEEHIHAMTVANPAWVLGG